MFVCVCVSEMCLVCLVVCVTNVLIVCDVSVYEGQCQCGCL